MPLMAPPRLWMFLPLAPPARLVPARLVPARLLPPRLLPPKLVPARLVPARLVPARLLPPRFGPPRLVPARLVPARFVPARLMPARFAPWIGSVSSPPGGGSRSARDWVAAEQPATTTHAMPTRSPPSGRHADTKSSYSLLQRLKYRETQYRSKCAKNHTS